MSHLETGRREKEKLKRTSDETKQILEEILKFLYTISLIFNIYSEYVFREALEDLEVGIQLNGEFVNNIRYADDKVIFADSPESLQYLVDKVDTLFMNSYPIHEFGLDINTNKTKQMVISKNCIRTFHLTIDQKPVERVYRYTFLGTNINEQWNY